MNQGYGYVSQQENGYLNYQQQTPAMQAAMATTMQTAMPTAMQTAMPTAMQTAMPTAMQTAMPTAMQTAMPTTMQTAMPTAMQTAIPAANQWPMAAQPTQQIVWGSAPSCPSNDAMQGYSQHAQPAPVGDDGQPVTTVYVACDNVKRLIGKGGTRIRELEETTHAKIKVMKDGASNGHTPVELHGSHEAREEARQTIEHMFDNFQGGGSRNDGFGGGWSGDQSSTIYVPFGKVGRLIGRGGSRIREIQETTGAIVKIKKESQEDGMVPCELRGSSDCREEAKRVIAEVCENDGPQQYGGGSQGGDDHQNRSGFSQGGGDEVTTMHVSERQVGKLIGKGGSNIRSIQDNSGAKIKVKKENMEAGQVPVEIRGMKDACDEAKRTIEQLFEDEGSSGVGGGGGDMAW